MSDEQAREELPDEIGMRAYSALQSHRILTIGDLVKHTRNDLAKIRGLGHKSLRRIEDVLHARGLRLLGGGEQLAVEVDALKADNARLRALIKDKEYAHVGGEYDEGDGYRAQYDECPWCGGDAVKRHADDCPAFTPEGEVK